MEDLERKRKEYVGRDVLAPARLEQLRGLPQVREELVKLIQALKSWERLECRLPAGALFTGPPGSGKTLAARILATESGLKLVDGTNFPRAEGHWEPDDIVSLFTMARSLGKPVIIHFEELADFWKMNPRTELQTALLSQLDGISGRPSGVFVVACTNEFSKIPPQFLRPGRLSKVIEFNMNSEGRKEVFRYYLSRKPLDSFDVESLLSSLPDSISPAAIEELVEDAHLASLLEGSGRIREAHLVRGLLEYVLGPPQGGWENERERWVTCVHEAGHVLVASSLGIGIKMVVVPKQNYRRGVAVTEKDQPRPKNRLEKEICLLVAGKVAERMVLGCETLDSAEDAGKATSYSLDYYSMFETETNYQIEELKGIPGIDDSPLKPLPERERVAIYSKARELRERCAKRAEEILLGFGKEAIERLAREIQEREYLLRGQLESLVGQLNCGPRNAGNDIQTNENR